MRNASTGSNGAGARSPFAQASSQSAAFPKSCIGSRSMDRLFKICPCTSAPIARVGAMTAGQLHKKQKTNQTTSKTTKKGQSIWYDNKKQHNQFGTHVLQAARVEPAQAQATVDTEGNTCCRSC